MSKHSHWAKIKHGKGSSDVQRGALFSKLARLVTVAARDGGDPLFNFKLRMAVDRAKSEGMSKDAIERAIARGAGSGGDGAIIETVLYEGFAPGGAAVLIECLTDNRNRALGAVKGVFVKQGGTLGGEGSVRWKFQRAGVLRIVADSRQPIADSEEFELELIGAGAEDIREEDGTLIILTKPEELQKVREAAERSRATVADAGLEWIPKQFADVAEGDRKKFETFLGALDDLDDVQEVYTNARGY